MPFIELWGAAGNIDLDLPNRPLAYLLLLVYLALFVYLIYQNRHHFSNSPSGTTSRDWSIIAGLAVVALITSQLLPIRLSLNEQLSPLFTAVNPIAAFIPFVAVPILLVAAAYNPLAALIVGAAAGFGHALGQSHQLFDIFHFAFIAFLGAHALQQNYIGRLANGLRHPSITGAAVFAIAGLLMGVAAFFTADAGANYLTSIDFAISTATVNFVLVGFEGVVGGGIVWLIWRGLPHLRPSRHLVPSPRRLSIRRTLLSNFIRYAFVFIMLLAIFGYILATNVSTKLVINQMAIDANRALERDVPAFQTHLQALLQVDGVVESLLSVDSDEQEEMLDQLLRTPPAFFRTILLVMEDETVLSSDESSELQSQERTAVNKTFNDNNANITSIDIPQVDHILSFVAPIMDDNGEIKAVLVGRVPEISLKTMIGGVQDVVGEGIGFVVDENQRIIAHPDSTYLLQTWSPPPETRLRQLNPDVDIIETAVESRAYQSRREDSNARELVYHVTGANPAWTVVVTVPYEVVLEMALSIGWSIGLVMVVLAVMFAFNLNRIGREFAHPITELVEATKTIAAGGSLEHPIPTDRDDEIGQLGLSFTQMQRSLKQRLDELRLLLTVSHDVSASIDINYSMPVILQGTLRGTGAAGARAVLVNPSGGHPLTFGEGPASKMMASLDREVMFQLRDRNEMLLSSPNQISQALTLDRSEMPPVRAILALPLLSHDRFQGILWLGFRQPRNFTDDERNLVHTLAGQASVVVENARLYSNAEGGRRRLAAVLASTSDAVIVTDQTERILLVNPALEKIFKLKAAEIMGRAVADVIPNSDLVTALTENEASGNSEVPAENGRTYYTSVSTIVRNDGQVLGRVAVLHDITHFKELDELKSEFVSTVSHDLRSPLTFMRGYGTMLPMVGELNDKQAEYLDKIMSGIEQMAKLVEDLLEIARAEAGVDLRQDDIELQELLSDVTEEHWQHAHFSGINIQLDVTQQLPTIKGSAAEIRRAVSNFITNGIKYAPNSGIMTVKAEQVNGEVIVSVKDNGPGIPQQDLMRVFEKFERIKQRGTENVKGSGLGLAFVKTIAEKHGGRVWCQSQVGKGSVFGMSLPLIREEEPI